MFARVQTFSHSVEKLDELTAVVKGQLAYNRIPPGLKGAHYLIDREPGKALLIFFWETKDALRRLEATNAATRERVEANNGIAPPTAEVFEVAFVAPLSP